MRRTAHCMLLVTSLAESEVQAALHKILTNAGMIDPKSVWIGDFHPKEVVLTGSPVLWEAAVSFEWEV